MTTYTSEMRKSLVSEEDVDILKNYGAPNPIGNCK